MPKSLEEGPSPRIKISIPPSLLDRLRAVLRPGEDMSLIARVAIEKMVCRREKAGK